MTAIPPSPSLQELRRTTSRCVLQQSQIPVRCPGTSIRYEDGGRQGMKWAVVYLTPPSDPPDEGCCRWRRNSAEEDPRRLEYNLTLMFFRLSQPTILHPHLHFEESPPLRRGMKADNPAQNEETDDGHRLVADNDVLRNSGLLLMPMVHRHRIQYCHSYLVKGDGSRRRDPREV
ncbi:hypothetical protein FMUND_13620 [Fusarium mundagurra]|uniref:Uncharacterized protein n=1 Tax=Fusarium mundagurra TaxID=1567541 RepID=A0A8H5XXJ3_9HYPO|nr:hypothetical protein FMUND_13620 [Fusarium mundagurra]